MSLQDSERGTRLAAGSLPVGVYRYVRLTLEEGAATLATGSEIGGLDLPYDVTLGLGAQDPVVAEKRLVQPLQVGPEGTALLLVDFNSERWVTEDNVLAGRVRSEELSAALTAGPSAVLAALFLSGL